MDTSTQATLPSINPDALILVLAHKSRWRLLKALTHGEPREVRELAKAAGCTYQNMSRHLHVLRSAGLVVRGRGGLYQIPKQFLPSPGQPIVDCGHCLLRLEAIQ